MAPMPRQLAYTPVSAADLLNVYAQAIDDLQTGVYGSAVRTHVPSCYLQLTSYHLTATGTNIVTWDAPVFDNDTMWSGSNPTLITINTPGQWLIIMNLVWAASATGHRWGFVTKNGTNVATNSLLFAGSTGPGQSSTGVAPAVLAVGDVLRCYTDQDSGGSLNLQNDFGGSKFGAVWVGP